MIRVAQLFLALSAVALWAGSRLPWVVVSSDDGLGQPRTISLDGASWWTALVPMALLVLAAAVAALAVRGWALRLLGGLVAVVSGYMAYLGVGFWVLRDAGLRATELAEIPVTALRGTERHHLGAALTLVAAACALVGAVLLVRSAAKGRSGTAKYAAPGARRDAARREAPDAGMSERMIWDALDEGRDPTASDNEGR